MLKYLVTLMLAGGVAASGVSVARADDKPILIGAAVGLSGWIVPYDVPPLRAAEMAIDDINAKGGLLGRSLELKVIDSKTDQSLNAQAGAELIDEGAELLLTSCDFDMGGPAAIEANDAGVPVFSLCAGDHKFGVSGIGRYAFTMTTTGANEGYIAAEWAHKDKGWRNAYMLFDTSIQYTKSLCGGFKDRWQKFDNVALKEDVWKNGDPSIASQITRLRGLSPQPDFIFLCSYAPGGVSAVRQLRAAGVDLPILSGGPLDGVFWKESVPDLNDFYYPVWASMWGDNPWPGVDEFFAQYEKRYGEAAIHALTVYGYAAIEIWAKAVERAGTTDGEAVVAELEKMDREPTLGGPTTFSQTVHYGLGRPMVMIEVQNWEHNVLGAYEAEQLPQLD